MSAIVEARNRERQAMLAQVGPNGNAPGDVLGRILQFFSVRGGLRRHGQYLTLIRKPASGRGGAG